MRAEAHTFLQRVSLSWLGLLVYGYLFAHAAVFTDTDLAALPPAPWWIAVILLCAKLADVGWEAARRLGVRSEDLQMPICAFAGALGGGGVQLALSAAGKGALPEGASGLHLVGLGLVVGLGLGAASRTYKLIVTDVLGEDPARPMKGTMLFGFAFALAIGYYYVRNLT